jgi:hypothetical protein
MVRSTARLAAKKRVPAQPPYRRSSDGRVIFLRPAAATTKHVDASTDACVKCASTFISYEPAFIHCHCCGNMARIAGGSLLAQELWEIRSGFRIAS